MSTKQVMQPPGSCNCSNMRRAARAITKIYDKALEPSGLKSTQFAALMHIKSNGPLNISALSKIMVLDRTTLVRNIKPLVEAGFIENTTTPDPRERQVNITENGRQVINLALPYWREVQKKMAHKVGKEDLTSLERIVTVLEGLIFDNIEAAI